MTSPKYCPVCGRGLSAKWRIASHDVRIARRIRRRPDFKRSKPVVCRFVPEAAS